MTPLAGHGCGARLRSSEAFEPSDERKGATVGVLQRFERRLEGMVGVAFARIFKGKVHPAEIAKALTREADEQRSVLGEGRVLAPNVYDVRLGPTDYDNLAEWSEELAARLADMVSEHIEAEGYQVFGEVQVRLDRDEELRTGVFEVGSHVADPARPAPRAEALAVPPATGGSGVPPLPPLRGRVATDTGRQSPSVVGRAGSKPGITHVLLVDGPGTRHELTNGRNIIGRGTDADIRLPDTGVSRKHVDVVLDGATAIAEDLGSTNGTLVNGRRITRQPLSDGDVIRIGHSVLVYRQDGA
ncbi:FHA domain-containing protein [Geodermatophilus ruber]|uniref:FHA domain-containing protein n=1 Tax=Geodermatophilus ruber TaxID=504800 RepID=A0A1I4J9G7_9ACTN|nr:FHA domain-containing protein [Geodermatophilus ruber]